ncbi:GMC family oxidoreductase [Nostoc sp. CENA67]|uniref:GMC family oxidoreductase n=1 Tax=Amazonocrinis nigriterrae CENA67 TaxID=2794033 RepID=A0A8J7LAZ1_9NOST|nr:GMC family oxidoreductase [Amazonocrinis nigriterrae]MBH8566033.1 GMC family oxidoreductase [Amazonocrinis nigriterrae CENA67]
MIYELSQDGILPTSLYDLCIIGSGPAGATIVNVLADSNYKICVLESGSYKPEKFTDALREVDHEGILIKSYSRERVLGGTSTTWSGLSSPLDPIDFRKRDWVKYSGWPIDLDELTPYYIAASHRFRFPSWEKFKDSDWMGIRDTSDLIPCWKELEEKIFVASEYPQNFGKEFQDIYNKKNIDLYIGCTITHLDGCSETGRVKKAIARYFDGRKIEFQANIFVLACGGIENPRILLNSTFACPAGLGNDKDQVGRYFMNHPKNNYGFIQLIYSSNNLPGYFGFLSLKTGYAGYIGLRIKETVQENKRILNSYIRFEPVFDWSGRESIESLNYFSKKSQLLLKTVKHLKKDKLLFLRDYSETGDDSNLMNERKNFKGIIKMIGKIALDSPAVLDYLCHRFFEQKNLKVTTINIRNFMEMEPLPQNRVTLSNCTDAFAMRLPCVIHTPSELDKRSMAAVHYVLSEELQRNRWGKLCSELNPNLEPWPIDLDASHHMGATRMGNDSSSSVVNPQCCLHFSPNVYLAGASTFPTSGNANPTFTIVALAIRLAEHLKIQLSHT